MTNAILVIYFNVLSLSLDKPSQPGEIDIISVTKDCITIHWLRPEYDGGKEILGYWIEFRQAGESAWKKCNKERSRDRQFTMGGLIEATEYEFRVFAENETGISRPRRTAMGIKTKLSGTLIRLDVSYVNMHKYDPCGLHLPIFCSW